VVLTLTSLSFPVGRARPLPRPLHHGHLLTDRVESKRNHPRSCLPKRARQSVLLSNGLVDRVLVAHRLVVLLLFPALRHEHHHSALSLPSSSSHALDQSDGGAGYVIENNEVHLSNIQTFFSNTGGHQSIEVALFESLHHLQLVFLGKTFLALSPSLTNERHGSNGGSLIVQTGNQLCDTISKLGKDDHSGFLALFFCSLEVQPGHVEQFVHLRMRRFCPHLARPWYLTQLRP